jgi:hypothetical protein
LFHGDDVVHGSVFHDDYEDHHHRDQPHQVAQGGSGSFRLPERESLSNDGGYGGRPPWLIVIKGSQKRSIERISRNHSRKGKCFLGWEVSGHSRRW